MLKENRKLPDRNALFGLRKDRKETSAFDKGKRFCFFMSILTSLILIIAVYLCLDISNVYHIAVEGNHYLNDDDVLALSRLSTKSKFLSVIPYRIEKNVLSSPLISECKVELKDGRLVKINVKEKNLIGYMPENGLNVLISDNDDHIAIDMDNFYIISKLPLLEGFTPEELILIEKNLSKCDYRVIDEISEIHSFKELKYQNVEIIMRDGNFIFSSPYGLEILNRYFDIESSYLSGKNKCYYFEDISGNAYTSACPWEKTEEEKKDEKTAEENAESAENEDIEDEEESGE